MFLHVSVILFTGRGREGALPNPPGGDPRFPPPPDTVNKRTVHIQLGCIIVINILTHSSCFERKSNQQKKNNPVKWALIIDHRYLLAGGMTNRSSVPGSQPVNVQAQRLTTDTDKDNQQQVSK